MRESKAIFCVLITLLLVGMVSMVGVIPVEANPTTLYVNPANTIDNTLQPQPTKTIKPMADGMFTDWTGRTLTIRPDGDGTYKNWTGRTLTLNPSGDGTFKDWPATIPPITFNPRGNGVWNNWTGYYTDWDDWPTPDGDSSVVTTTLPSRNETSTLTFPPFEQRAYAIAKVTLTIVAKNTLSSDERVRFLLVVGGNLYNGSTCTPTTSYVSYSYDWLTSPATNKNWTWPELETFEAGVRSEQTGTTWTGELRVTQLYVNVLLRDYTAWDDWPDNNGDTDYVSANADAMQESSGLPNHTIENWNILKVSVTIAVKTSSAAADDQVAPILVIGGTAYPGSGWIPTTTTSYKEYSFEWSKNPRYPSLNWNWSAIDALEAGVKTIKGSGPWQPTIRVTQLYVKVIETGTAAYQQWDEATPDGDNTYVSALSGKLNQSSTLQNHQVGDTWSIASVQVTIIAKTDVLTDEQVTLMLVVGGKQYSGDTYYLINGTYATYSSVWSNNPRYGYNWNWSAIDALEAGVKSVMFGSVWTGEIRITQLFVVVGESGGYANWDEWPAHDSDASYVSATTGEMKESSALEDIGTYPSWTIARVRVVIYARTDVFTDEQVELMLVLDGVEYLGAAYVLNTNYAECIGDWGRNPATGSYWTWPDIDALEAGVYSKVSDDGIWTGEVRVTQLYVEVAGPRYSVDINVSNVVDLYTFDFCLNYTGSLTTATAITLGSFFPYGSNEWRREMHEDLGYVRYMVSMPPGSPYGKDGSGTLARIDFIVKSYGETDLDLCNVKLSNHSGDPISYEAYDGYFSNKILGDVNSDKAVNVSDLFYVGKAYGSDSSNTTGNWNPHCDFNRDGKVNKSDLSELSSNYGKRAP